MMDSVGVQSELESRGCIMRSLARSGEITLNSLYNINARQLPVWSGGMDLLTEDLQNLLNRNMACIVLAGAEENRGNPCKRSCEANPRLVCPHPTLRLKPGACHKGRAGWNGYPDANLAVITHGRERSANPANQAR